MKNKVNAHVLKKKITSSPPRKSAGLSSLKKDVFLPQFIRGSSAAVFLRSRITSRKAKIGVIGLGYVGLPLAILFARQRFDITGFVKMQRSLQEFIDEKSSLLSYELNSNLKSLVKDKKLSIKKLNKKDLINLDVIVICVPTPLDDFKKPDLHDLKSVRDALSKIDLTGKLIVNESTVSPFTTRKMFGDLMGKYFLACSPERIDPGNKAKTVENISKVVGGVDKDSLMLAESLYKEVLRSKLILVSSLEAAEMTKMLENTYRCVNIALVNEFSLLCDACNLDVLEVINAAESKWSFHSHFPGIGVGGHCIPVDPYYLLELANEKKLALSLVKKGLDINEQMPRIVFEKIKKYYKKPMKVLIYGLTYKRDVADLRESPVIKLCKLLQDEDINFSVFDPLLPTVLIQKMGFVPGKLMPVDMFIVGTDHNALKKDYAKAVTEDTIVIDGRNFFTSKVGKRVYGIGRTFL